MLAYSRCMRAHGISDFPDPQPAGDFQLNAAKGSDLDPRNPRFQAANEACKGFRAGSGASTSGASWSTRLPTATAAVSASSAVLDHDHRVCPACPAAGFARGVGC